MISKNKIQEILLFDTSIATDNMGDFIIMEAVRRHLYDLFPESFFVSTATHERISHRTYKWASKAELSFLGGTNILSGKYPFIHGKQWDFNLKDAIWVNNVVGIGLGWQDYRKFNHIYDIPQVKLQQILLNRSLSSKYLHSVRDSFTENRLKNFGIDSINTSCVTMWNLTQDLLRSIPKEKAKTVVFTLTDYRSSGDYKIVYKEMLEILLKNYDNVFMWVQSRNDVDLLFSLDVVNSDKVKFISPNLSNYDAILSKDVDYIGTRLHAGIRALQHKKRTIIIGVDNRAKEIATDTNLPVLDYKGISKLDNILNKSLEMDIHVPFDNIKKWKSQFID